MSSYYENGLEDDDLYEPEILHKLDLKQSKLKFSPDISIENPGSNLRVRPLKSGDYDRGYLELLSQLTKVSKYTKEQFQERFQAMKRCPDTYFVTVIEDMEKDQVIGTATLSVELKFIRNATKRGRMEDVVVSDEYRGKQLGKLLIATIQLLSQLFGCYKISLDCKDEMVQYYKNMGFGREEGNSTTMVIRYDTQASSA